MYVPVHAKRRLPTVMASKKQSRNEIKSKKITCYVDDVGKNDVTLEPYRRSQY
jgi:hypothetical protein